MSLDRHEPIVKMTEDDEDALEDPQALGAFFTGLVTLLALGRCVGDVEESSADLFE